MSDSALQCLVVREDPSFPRHDCARSRVDGTARSPSERVHPDGPFASAKIGKRIVTQVMTELVADDVLTEPEAQSVGEMILSGTTKRIYNL